MEQPKGPGLDEMLIGLRRRPGLIASIFVLGTALGVAVAWFLPSVYSSTAKILVERQQIPDELARSTITSSAGERLEVLEQRLMTRENLLAIAGQLDLFANRPGMSPTDRILAMRAATSIDPITISRGRSTDVTAFTITYRSSNPDHAALVANEFVTRILERNLEQRSLRAIETNSFFKSEIDRLGREIAETERRIQEFKTSNEGRLPEGQTFRHEELIALQQRRFGRETRRIELEEQKRLLSQTMSEGLPAGQAVLTPNEQQLMELEQTLAQRRAILAESHPEIRALRRRIAALEQNVMPASGPTGEPAASPAERRMEQQLGMIDNQLTLLADQDLSDQARQQKLEEAIEASPGIELALAGLYRRYDDLQLQRQAAVQKQAEAEVGERLEINQQAERFEVIEAAQRPVAPQSPNRKLIAVAAAAGSLGLALALAVMIELMKSTFTGPVDFERRTKIRPIVTVPWIATPGERRRRRRRRVMAGLSAAVALPLLLGFVDRRVMPLPVLADTLMDRSGLGDLRGLSGAFDRVRGG